MTLHSVVETPAFISDASAAGITPETRLDIVNHFARNPSDGVLVQGTGGARKVRFSGRGKGKSGGYRVIAYYSGEDVPVFLLNVFSKGDKVDLSKAERNALRRELEALAEDYRRGVPP